MERVRERVRVHHVREGLVEHAQPGGTHLRYAGVAPGAWLRRGAWGVVAAWVVLPAGEMAGRAVEARSVCAKQP